MIESAPFAECPRMAPGTDAVCSACWSLDGSAIFCGCQTGQLRKVGIGGESQSVPPMALPNDVQPGAEANFVWPLNERFLLVVHAADPFPFFSVLDLDGGTLHECGSCCIPGRDYETTEHVPRTRFFCHVLPEWRMAVVCSSDSDEVCCLGSRKAGANQLWQRWNLPDEEGPPSIPTFERDDLFEDQYVMGLALDLVNQEQLTLVAGEEQFPPSPVLWCLTSHNSIVAWTAIHKKAKSDAGKYTFMRTNEPLPALTAVPSPAAAPAFNQPTAASSAPAAPAAPTTSGAAASATADKDLLGAAEMGDHDALMKALEDGAQLDAVDEKTHTALHWAAKCGRADDIEALTAAGAPLNAKTKTGVTPLIYAASEGWDDCVQLLLAAGADPTLQTGKGRTAREATSTKMAKADAESKPRFVKVLQLLDAPAAAAAASGGGLLGAAPAPAATSGGLFGAAPAPAAASGGLFGAAPAPAAASGGLFGAVPAPAAAAASGGGLFGAAPAPAAASGGLFGAAAAKNKQAQSQAEAAEPALSQVAVLPSPRHPPLKGQGLTSSKASYRASRPETSAASLKPGVLLGADLQGILVDVSNWSGVAGPELGGAFTRLFDSRLQRVAELEELLKQCATKLQQCDISQEAAQVAPALQCCEDALDELQSKKEGIHTKLQQLEAQQHAVLQPSVKLLQHHEPGPGPLVSDLAVAPLLLNELDRLQATEDQLEQGLLRLERRFGSLETEHWSALTEKVERQADIVRRHELRVAALRDAAGAFHVRAHSSASLIPSASGEHVQGFQNDSSLVSSRLTGSSIARTNHEAPCLMRLRDRLRRRDTYDDEAVAVRAVEDAAQMSAPVAAVLPSVEGRRSVFAELAGGKPTDPSFEGGGSAPPLFAPAVSIEQTKAPSAAPGLISSGKTQFAASAANSLSSLPAGGSTSPAFGFVSTAASLPAPAPAVAGSLLATSSEPAGLLSALSFPKTADAMSQPKQPLVAGATPNPAQESPQKPTLFSAAESVPNRSQGTEASAKPSLTPSLRVSARQPAAGSGLKPSEPALVDSKDSPDEQRLKWYARQKPTTGGAELLFGPTQPQASNTSLTPAVSQSGFASTTPTPEASSKPAAGNGQASTIPATTVPFALAASPFSPTPSAGLLGAPTASVLPASSASALLAAATTPSFVAAAAAPASALGAAASAPASAFAAPLGAPLGAPSSPFGTAPAAAPHGASCNHLSMHALLLLSGLLVRAWQVRRRLLAPHLRLQQLLRSAPARASVRS